MTEPTDACLKAPKEGWPVHIWVQHPEYPRTFEVCQFCRQRKDCTGHNKPNDFYTPLPDGEGHCTSCHCWCDGWGPTCGHWAGCPGC